MALKADAEDVRDKADRIVRLVLKRQATKFYADGDEDPDFEMDVTPEMKQAWGQKIKDLQDQIKAIVGGW